MRDITGARTTEVLIEYAALWDMLQGVQLLPNVPDRFIWKWAAGGEYSCSSAYHAFFLGAIVLPGAKEVWRASTPPPKSSYFFWLALYGRLWTSDQRRKHDLQSEADCALCGQEDETYDHLLAFLRLHHGRLVPPSRSRWSSAPSAGQHDAHLQLVAMHTGNGS